MRFINKYKPRKEKISGDDVVVEFSAKALHDVGKLIEAGNFEKRVAGFTAILALVSAIFSGVGALATKQQASLALEQTDLARRQTAYARDQLTMAQQNLNIAQVNSSYEGYISSLTNLCSAIDATKGEVNVETSYDDRGFQIIARYSSTGALANDAHFFPASPQYKSDLKLRAQEFENSMILTNIWASKEISIPLERLGSYLLGTVDFDIAENGASQHMLVSYGYCRHMVTTAEAIIGNKKIVSETDLFPILAPEDDPQKEIRTDINPSNYSLYKDE